MSRVIILFEGYRALARTALHQYLVFHGVSYFLPVRTSGFRLLHARNATPVLFIKLGLLFHVVTTETWLVPT